MHRPKILIILFLIMLGLAAINQTAWATDCQDLDIYIENTNELITELQKYSTQIYRAQYQDVYDQCLNVYNDLYDFAVFLMNYGVQEEKQLGQQLFTSINEILNAVVENYDAAGNDKTYIKRNDMLKAFRDALKVLKVLKQDCP